MVGWTGALGFFCTTSSKSCWRVQQYRWESVGQGVGATEWEQLLERGGVSAAQIEWEYECGWVNAARMQWRAYSMCLRSCSSWISRLLAMLEYQGSWHFCWKIHGTKTRYKWQAQWDEITCNACKTAMKAEYVGSWSRKFSPYAERLCSNLVLQKDHYAKIIVPGNSQCQRIVLWLRDHLQSSKYWRLLNSAGEEKDQNTLHQTLSNQTFRMGSTSCSKRLCRLIASNLQGCVQ